MTPYDDPGASRSDGDVDLRDVLDRELRRGADRLRTLDLGRLERPGPDGRTTAERAHDTAQALADLAADGTLAELSEKYFGEDVTK